MFSSLTPGEHSVLARSRARSNECLGRKPTSPKHSIMTLLRELPSKSPGMIFLQDASIRSRRRKGPVWSNSIRICTLKDKRARGAVAAKRLRMIFLQNSNNKTPGITLLQKKVGGRGPFGARESHGHQELSRANKGRGICFPPTRPWGLSRSSFSVIRTLRGFRAFAVIPSRLCEGSAFLPGRCLQR